jgi:hypothetical protein
LGGWRAERRMTGAAGSAAVPLQLVKDGVHPLDGCPAVEGKADRHWRCAAAVTTAEDRRGKIKI